MRNHMAWFYVDVIVIHADSFIWLVIKLCPVLLNSVREWYVVVSLWAHFNKSYRSIASSYFLCILQITARTFSKSNPGGSLTFATFDRAGWPSYYPVSVIMWPWAFGSLQWHHNGCDGVSNHQPHGCLLNRLFGRRSKKTSKPRVTCLCAVNSPGTGEFPAQMPSNAENVSIWSHHHVEFNCRWISSIIHIVISTDKLIHHISYSVCVSDILSGVLG